MHHMSLRENWQEQWMKSMRLTIVSKDQLSAEQGANLQKRLSAVVHHFDKGPITV